MFYMKRGFLFFILAMLVVLPGARAETFTSCGPGYVLVSHKNIDGIKAAECQKLWCRDLETGKMMGSGDKANSGYQATAGTVELCDAANHCVECWGARKWCSGEVRGDWNPAYGAYTRGGDNVTYQSYQKGSCFAWRLEKPQCPDGQAALLQGDEWVCATMSSSPEAVRASAVRRTGTIRRIKR